MVTYMIVVTTVAWDAISTSPAVWEYTQVLIFRQTDACDIVAGYRGLIATISTVILTAVIANGTLHLDNCCITSPLSLLSCPRLN